MVEPSSESKSSLSEQLIHRLIELIVTGSSGSALYFLYTGKLAEAAIGGLVATGAGLLTNFGQRLMKPIENWIGDLGEKSGHRITKVADGTLETWSGIDQKYLKALQGYCYDLEVEGLKGDFPSLALEEVFVPLSLDADPARFAISPSIRQIWSLLPRQGQLVADNRYRRIAIVANPGYGKTTLTRYLTLKYANSSYHEFGAADLLPILLILRSIYADIRDEQTPMLPDMVQKQVKGLPRCQDLDVSADWFEKQLESGRCLVMLDGLDEVPEVCREIVSKWAKRQMQTYPSQFILTSRPHGYDEGLFQGVERISIVDFNLDQKEDFIYKWYKAVLWHKKWESHWQLSQAKPNHERLSPEQAKAQSDAEAEAAAEDLIRQIIEIPSLNELAKNPLLITIIAATHRAFASLPKRRVEIYKKMFDLLLADRPNYRDTPLTIPTAEENQQILQKLALALMNKGKTEFTVNQTSKPFQPLLAKYDAELTPEKFLWEIKTIAGLLTGESDLYQFSHKTFQEYLAAVELKQHKRSKELLIQKIMDGAWKDWEEVIRFYATMTDATQFVQAILKTTDKDALLLAYRIGIEDTRKISPALKSHLYKTLSEIDLGRELNAKVKLEEQFQTQLLLNETTIISSQYITWKEYQLFLKSQQTGQFHSTAMVGDITDRPLDSPKLDICWIDAQWFCAWLSTQTHLQPEDGVYIFRLPTAAELIQVRSPKVGIQNIQPWLSTPDSQSNALRIVREHIDNHYRYLVNFLANGRWKEADQETERLMLELAGQQEEGHLTIDSLKTFPCQDLDQIDQLWFRFSGGKFGLSVQKQLWLSVGGRLDFGTDNDVTLRTFRELSDRTGWRSKREWLNYTALNFSMNAPPAHLPTLYRACRISPGINLGQAWIGWCAILSRLGTCAPSHITSVL
ncbi:NACHT domain-containing protein [Pantanalinema rosaneae CENA516]|uniref:NACHT domain-containing protein n=1 Tax=Pantanalinema rosaneae TaxID=1620701 RepID=UPI003D6DCD3C